MDFPKGTQVTLLPSNALTVGELRDRLYNNNVGEYCAVKCQTETGRILGVVSLRIELESNPHASVLVLEVME